MRIHVAEYDITTAIRPYMAPLEGLNFTTSALPANNVKAELWAPPSLRDSAYINSLPL